MIYDINSKGDILSGAELIVKIPEEDLDRKALYTIQEDRPDFILPFRYRIVDGQIEFVYQIGAYSKLEYFAGDRNPKEYAQLWSGILSPLFECGDWFLKPYSFVLDIKHLYSDKHKNSVCYVYIPSIPDCSDYCSLKDMAASISRQITVNDLELENKVIRSIMMDFNPGAFIQMLKPYTTENAPVTSAHDIPPQYAAIQKAPQAQEQPASKHINPRVEQETQRNRENERDNTGEFIIDIPDDPDTVKKSKKNKKDRESLRKENDKQSIADINSGTFFGKKLSGKYESKRRAGPDPQQPVATAPPWPATTAPQQTSSATPQQLLSVAPQHMPPVAPQQTSSASPEQLSSPPYAQSMEPENITDNIPYIVDGALLRLIGSAHLPPAIDIALGEGEVFTVGRYDTSVGKKRSSFEFDRMTRAVSRRHAAIERNPDGYSLIDLSSSAGTFLDGQRLPPNTPCKLQTGCQVSFGNCGADYVWEQ